MNRNIIILTIFSLVIIVFGILLTTYGIIKLSNLAVEKEFSSTLLEDQFDLFIYTPPAYSLQYKQSYPVLYLLDGNHYFLERKEERRTKWSMQKTIDRLIKEKRLPSIIVVGITPVNKRGEYYLPNQYGGQLEAFVPFITDELKAYIDTKYRTKREAEHTGIMGAGLGGLASLHIGSIAPDVFGKVGALGPVKEETEAPMTTEELLKEMERVQADSFALDDQHKQVVHLMTNQLLNASETDLDQQLEKMLLSLFGQ